MTASENARPTINIRQIQNRDWPKVTFGSKRWGTPPFIGQELVRLMMQEDTATTVAEDAQKRIVGYAVVQKDKESAEGYHLVTLAVDYDARRKGVGTDLVNHAISLINWSDPGKDFTLSASVHVDDVDAQQFLGACGLRADAASEQKHDLVMQRGLLTLEEKAFLAAEKLSSVTGVHWALVRKHQDGSMEPVDLSRRLGSVNSLFFKTAHTLAFPGNACDILTKLGCRNSEIMGRDKESGAAYITLPFGSLDAVAHIDLPAGKLADDFAPIGEEQATPSTSSRQASRAERERDRRNDTKWKR